MFRILVLTVSVLLVMGVSTYVDAEEVIIKKPQLSIGNQHVGSMVKSQTVSSDGSIWIFVTATEPVERERMTISVTFTDQNGKIIKGINYDITATQDGQNILSEKMVHLRTGSGSHFTKELPSSGNVRIDIVPQGTGVNPPFSGAQEDSIHTDVVPEFGLIAPLVLGVSVLSILILSVKNKTLFTPKINN